jgi:hypothetical protein
MFEAIQLRCSLIAIALLLAFASLARAQSVEARPQLLVEFCLKLTPDLEAQRAGAVTFRNQVGMANGVWTDQFTGYGCVSGPFESSVIEMPSASGASDTHPFAASCRSRSKDDTVSLIEWRGKLEDGKISGDVWITLPGEALSPAQIATKRIDRDAAKRDATPMLADGTVVNEKAGEHAGGEVDRKNALLAIEGRRLHFTFITDEVVIIPVGSWSGRKPPTTAPSTQPS